MSIRAILHRVGAASLGVAGLAALLDWFVDIRQPMAISSSLVTMKPQAAICFIMCSIILYGIVTGPRDARVQALSIGSCAICTLASTLILLAMVIGGEANGVGRAVIEVNQDSAAPMFFGTPSLATMLAFALLAIYGIVHVLWPEYQSKAGPIFGTMLVTTGGLAIIGHLFRIPELYYYIPYRSATMPVLVALLFVITGVVLWDATRGALK